MARLERPTSENSNPAYRFLEWKSNEKCFSYYDKEKKENVNVELPIKGLFLEHYHTVKGWHDKSESGIYSNEVYSIANEEISVKAFKGGEIASGIYKDIKERIKNSGGRYTRSIYLMDEDGHIFNLQLKGAAVGGIKKEKSIDKEDVPGYSDFYRENSHLLDNQWVEITEAKGGKSGSVKYSIPLFEVGEVIDRATDELANKAAKTLQEYIDGYRAKNIEVKEPVMAGDDEGGLIDELDL
ncbi:hypothetical protein [Aegicerativicinus sediminis]|uniref:hypothetical protein n=1 Tax=Aegicerativicinus sediminis TaxID=2893202 RepID=UPI001E573EDB|nr:hypothetical protein [Aegicerativicinus sediminis]